MTNLENSKFSMSEPRPIGTRARFAFWLETRQSRLIDFVASLHCVSVVHRESEKRAMVEIKDDYDADEAWHHIRTELEEESNYVILDKMWEDALWL
jgi:hypothetical protein